MTSTPQPHDVLVELGRKYLWWKPVAGVPFSDARIIAQTMNLGIYDDILLLEQVIGRPQLLQVMRAAEPGWFNNRSWEFWRGRLSHALGVALPDEPPRRSFDAAMS